MLTTTGEQLTQALHSVQFAEDHLRESLKTSAGVDGIVILRLLQQAVELRQQLQLLIEVGQYGA